MRDSWSLSLCALVSAGGSVALARSLLTARSAALVSAAVSVSRCLLPSPLSTESVAPSTLRGSLLFPLTVRPACA